MDVLPDVELIVGKYLRSHPDISVKVGSRLPANFADAWVKFTQLNATNHPTSPVEHLVIYDMQFDCYGSSGSNSQTEASALARAVRAALVDLPNQDLDDVVVTQAVVTSHIRLPDQAFEPYRERYIVDCEIRAHG